jgi:hypothetical protein
MLCEMWCQRLPLNEPNQPFVEIDNLDKLSSLDAMPYCFTDFLHLSAAMIRRCAFLRWSNAHGTVALETPPLEEIPLTFFV